MCVCVCVCVPLWQHIIDRVSLYTPPGIYDGE